MIASSSTTSIFLLPSAKCELDCITDFRPCHSEHSDLLWPLRPSILNAQTRKERRLTKPHALPDAKRSCSGHRTFRPLCQLNETEGPPDNTSSDAGNECDKGYHQRRSDAYSIGHRSNPPCSFLVRPVQRSLKGFLR